MYQDGQYDKNNSVMLDGLTWTMGFGTTTMQIGKLVMSGDSITLYAEVDGKTESISGTVKDGVLTLTSMGTTLVFCKEGKAPSGGGGENPPVPQKYTVTYDANGGIFADEATTFEQKNIEMNSTLTAPTAPTKMGYQFVGWTKSKNGSEMWSFSTDTVTTNITLYALWQEEYVENEEYTVTYDANGGAFSGEATFEQTNIEMNSTLTAPTAPTKMGYKFAGWTKSKSGSEMWKFATDKVTTNITLYALWQEVYTVTYDANGGAFSGEATFEQKNIAKNSTLTAPAAPKRAGYQFAGWAKSKNSSEIWNFSTDKVTTNITLYALWQEGAAMIMSMDGASIDGTNIFMLVAHGTDSVSLSSKVVCSSDSIWKLYFDKLGQMEIPTKIATSKQGTLANGNNIFYIVVTSSNGSHVNVYELTVHRSYSVQVSFYDGDTLLQKESVYTGIAYTMNYSPSIRGYQFNGWQTSTGSEVSEITIWEHLSLYAIKTAKQYTVTLDSNGGDEITGTANVVTYDATYSLTIPNRTGYSFKGWYLEDMQLTDETGMSFAVWNYTDAITLSAKWKPNNYTVTLEQDPSAGRVLGAGKHTYDTNVTINAITNNGYTWVGWYDDSDTLVTESKEYTFVMGLDVTYTAHWILCPVTIVPSDPLAGKVEGIPLTTTPGDSITVKATTKNGYTWVGWYDSDTLVTESKEYTFVMGLNKVTYTARWILCPVTIEPSEPLAGKVEGIPLTTTPGDSITVKATTNNGYTWVGWYDSDTLVTESKEHTFVMGLNKVTYTARWILCPVTIVPSDPLAGKVEGMPLTTTPGDSITVKATTKNGYTWVGWYDDSETLVTESKEHTFVMGLNKVTYTARWILCPVTIVPSDPLAGKVEGSIPLTTTIGDSITVKATTKNGYTWVGWYDSETLVTESKEHTFVMGLNKVTYTARWILCPVTISPSDPLAGKVEGMPLTTTPGDSITVKATTNNGYTWVGWYDDSETLVTESKEHTFVMGLDKVTYTAHWILCPVTIVPSDPLAGKVEGSIPLTTTIGDSITVKATTKNGYTWVGWYDSETLVTESKEHTFVMGLDKVTYTAHWILCPVTIVPSDPLAGKVEGMPLTTTIGDEITVTATNNLGYSFSGWYNGEILLTKDYSYTFNISAENVTYTATYLVNEEMKNFKFSSTTTTCIIEDVKDKSIEGVVIPDYVTSIVSSAFSGCSSLTSITVVEVNSNYSSQDGILYNKAKTEFIHIPSSLAGAVVIPEGITIIGASAFSSCSGLTSITIPNSVTSIGDYAFSGCTSLASITVVEVNSNYSSQDGILYNKAKTEFIHIPSKLAGAVVIPEGIKTIGNSALSNRSGLTSITIPNSVTSIGYNAFSGCSGLTSITLPFVGEKKNGTGYTYFGYIFGASSYNDFNSVPRSLKTVVVTGGTIIGSYAFYGCSSLASIEIPTSVTTISERAFYNCISLTSIVIPNSVTSIGDWAFYGCSSLASIVIPNRVTGIGNYAFQGCSSLASIVIPNSVTGIGNYAFANCSSLASIVIPNRVTGIGNYAFANCSSLASIVIPNSVTSIGYNAFSGCSGLTSITLPFVGEKKNGTGYTHFGYIFGASSYNDFNSVPRSLKTVVVTGGTAISSNAFYNCYRLTSIEIPTSVTSIGNAAFYECSSLASIVIPNSVTAIYSSAFENCSGLTSITLPFVGEKKNGTGYTHFGYIFGASSYSNNESVVPTSLKTVVITGGTAISSYAFDGCSSLASIEIPNSVTSIGERAFYNCSSLASIEIPNSVTSIGSSAFSGCSSLASITVVEGNSNYSSQDGILYNKAKTEFIHIPKKIVGAVVIPEGITAIFNNAFFGCSSLASITVPDGVTSIGDFAFSLCSSLASIEIPNSVTSIGSEAFYGCSSLASIEIPASVTSIGNATFSGCSSLASIEIPNSVTSIGSSAFDGCSSLASINIGNSVTVIGSSAFDGCSSLASITYNGTTAQWQAITKGPSWNSNTGDYTVTCTNGTLTRSQS